MKGIILMMNIETINSLVQEVEKTPDKSRALALIHAIKLNLALLRENDDTNQLDPLYFHIVRLEEGLVNAIVEENVAGLIQATEQLSTVVDEISIEVDKLNKTSGKIENIAFAVKITVQLLEILSKFIP